MFVYKFTSFVFTSVFHLDMSGGKCVRHHLCDMHVEIVIVQYTSSLHRFIFKMLVLLTFHISCLIEKCDLTFHPYSSRDIPNFKPTG